MSGLNLTSIPKAYSAILFLQSPVVGLVIMAATLLHPNVGLAGLLAAVIAFGITRLWQFPDYAGQIQIFNSLLVGMSLGAFYQLNMYVIGVIVLGAILTTFIATVLADWLWRLDRLPVMSLPFVIMAAFMALVAKHFTELSDYLGLAQASYPLFHPAIDNFFSALGALYFTPEPAVGLLIFIVLAFYSRYLALLAVMGYVIGHSLLTVILFEPHPGFVVWTSFNFVLVAIALGGIFTIPGIASLVFAVIGVLVSVLAVIASQNLILVEGLPVMAVSFVITTLTMIMAMKKRLGLLKPYLAPEPGLPETNYEKARLAKVRYGEINSVPLLAPVFGNWTIYQGFNGPHTHKPPWQHALDFFITSNEKSFRNNGERVEDYYCFGAPVLSPAYADVVRCYDRLPDNAPGEVDTKNNWGNFILMRLDSGLHILLAHLQQGSIKVKESERVQPGKLLAACGNSGRSPQPHLHLQVQRSAELGSPTYPFHLASIMLHGADGSVEYQVVHRPEEGQHIEPATTDDQLASQLHLPVGRQLAYRLSGSQNKQAIERTLTVELTLLGQFRLRSDTGASAAFEENNGVLAFYDRKGPADTLLDMWLLAHGLTPLTEIAHRWHDAPSAWLLPMSAVERSVLSLLHPLGCGLHSEYVRHWDQQQAAWVQQGKHSLNSAALQRVAETLSIIDPAVGCREISLTVGDRRWQAQLLETGLIEDQGIPQRREQTRSGSHYDLALKH